MYLTIPHLIETSTVMHHGNYNNESCKRGKNTKNKHVLPESSLILVLSSKIVGFQRKTFLH